MIKPTKAGLNPKKADKQSVLTDQNQDDHFFIPDLCQINSVFFLLILTQLLALLLCFVSTENHLINWEKLGLISIFCHAITLSFATLICLTRPIIKNSNTRLVIIYFISANIAITWFFSWFGGTVVLPGVVSQPALFTLKNILISGMIASLLLRYFYLQFHLYELLALPYLKLDK